MSSPRAPRPAAPAAAAPSPETTPGTPGGVPPDTREAGSDAAALVAEAKRTARARVRRGRRPRGSLAADDPGRRREAQAVAAAILPHLPTARPPGELGRRTVASYVALPTEPPTAALHEELLARGIRVIVPVLLADKDLDWAELGRHSPPDDLLGREAIGDAALVVVPALQVDAAGRRLGQGGGSYDRALARRDPAAVVVAVIDDDGLVEAVPHEPHDACVAAVARPGAGWTVLPAAWPICETHPKHEDQPPAPART